MMEFVNGKENPICVIIYEMENKKCSKPPTRLGLASINPPSKSTNRVCQETGAAPQPHRSRHIARPCSVGPARQQALAPLADS